MKIPTDNLFQLIQAMSASEKRYFKRHYASEKSTTTELFDFINKMKSYDEEEVKNNFGSSKVSKNLKVYKVQLTDLILKSLISYHSKKSIRSKIRIGLEEIELLLTKQLYTLAQTRVKKIKELCLKYEELEYIFAVLYYEIMINSFFKIKLNNAEYPVLNEFDLFTDKIKNTYELKRLNFILSDKSNNKHTEKLSKKEQLYYSQLLDEHRQKTESGTLTFNGQYYLNSSLSLINQLVTPEPEKEYDFKKLNVDLFEKTPHFIENHTSYYFAALYNFLICCRKLGRHAELKNGIEKIKDLTQKYPYLERNLIFVYYLELKFNFQQKNYLSIVEEFEHPIIKHLKKYNQGEDNLSSLCYIYLALTHLVLNNAQKVQFYLRRLHSMAKQLNSSFALFFDILELISHYETQDYQIIENQLITLKRKSFRVSENDAFYTNMLYFFEDIIQPDANKNALVDVLQQQIKTGSKVGLLNLLNEFLLSEWLQSVKQNTPFYDYSNNR